MTDHSPSNERYVCDCGQVYTERAAVRECQAARHSAAAGCELADAEQFARRSGVSLDDLSIEEMEACERWESCSRCHGEKGGVVGNSNIVDGVLLCDYCHAEDLMKEVARG